MKQQVLESGAGQHYDWSSDHIVVKTPMAFTDGRTTLVEDTLKPGFRLARHHHKVMTEIFYILEGELTFAFDDETKVVGPGTTLNIPPNVWHEVTCPQGGKMLTIFSPGGFDNYLAELATMTPEQFADAALMQSLAERYDTWMA